MGHATPIAGDPAGGGSRYQCGGCNRPCQRSQFGIFDSAMGDAGAVPSSQRPEQRMASTLSAPRERLSGAPALEIRGPGGMSNRPSLAGDCRARMTAEGKEGRGRRHCRPAPGRAATFVGSREEDGGWMAAKQGTFPMSLNYGCAWGQRFGARALLGLLHGVRIVGSLSGSFAGPTRISPCPIAAGRSPPPHCRHPLPGDRAQWPCPRPAARLRPVHTVQPSRPFHPTR